MRRGRECTRRLKHPRRRHCSAKTRALSLWMWVRRREETCLAALEVRPHFIRISVHLDSSEYDRTGSIADVASLVNDLTCGKHVLEDRHACALTLCQGNQVQVAEEIAGVRRCRGCQVCRVQDTIPQGVPQGPHEASNPRAPQKASAWPRDAPARIQEAPRESTPPFGPIRCYVRTHGQEDVECVKLCGRHVAL